MNVIYSIYQIFKKYISRGEEEESRTVFRFSDTRFIQKLSPDHWFDSGHQFYHICNIALSLITYYFLLYNIVISHVPFLSAFNLTTLKCRFYHEGLESRSFWPQKWNHTTILAVEKNFPIFHFWEISPPRGEFFK